MHFVPINYSDSAFNPAFTADFQLIIILNQDTFSYAVRHPGSQRLVRVSTNQPLNELFETQGQLGVFGSSYQKITILVETNSFCLVPNDIFTPENLLDFASFLLVKEADVILTDQLLSGENTVIYTFPEILVQQIKTQFPAATIEFAPKSWIKTVFDAKLPNQNLYLFIEEKTLKILFPDQENIRFYNQFDCTTTDEMVYFTALVADQLKLKSEETSLILCGRIAAESEPMLRLQDFFKEVTLLATSDFGQKNTLQQHQIVQFLGLN